MGDSCNRRYDIPVAIGKQKTRRIFHVKPIIVLNLISKRNVSKTAYIKLTKLLINSFVIEDEYESFVGGR